MSDYKIGDKVLCVSKYHTTVDPERIGTVEGFGDFPHEYIVSGLRDHDLICHVTELRPVPDTSHYPREVAETKPQHGNAKKHKLENWHVIAPSGEHGHILEVHTDYKQDFVGAIVVLWGMPAVMRYYSFKDLKYVPNEKQANDLGVIKGTRNDYLALYSRGYLNHE